MKKLFSFKSMILLCVIAAVLISIPPGCKRDKASLIQQKDDISSKVANIKKWWEKRQINNSSGQDEVLSRIPDNMTIQSYWRSQFQNGIPKWSEARVFTVNDETIYEVPFQFPDDLVFLNDKPDAPPQYYLTGKAGSTQSYKTSQTYLVVKEKPGTTNVAEIMCVVLDNPYVKILDSIGTSYPTIRIDNVYPAPNNLGEFSGSVKFYDLEGVQLLEESFLSGSLNDYIQYGRCNFPVTPSPNLPTTRTYSVCKWTYVYQQNCGPEAGCTDWVLIGIIFNGCETITVPDSPLINLGNSGGTDGSGPGGGHSGPPPPPIQAQVPVPHAQLRGNYTWKAVGDAKYCQIRNLGATFVKLNSNIPPQTIVLGLVCIEIPKHYAQTDAEFNEFVNRAYNRAVDKVLSLLNNANPYLLAGTSSAIEPKFKQFFRDYLVDQPYTDLYNATITYHNGCLGQIPISEPKYGPPLQQPF